MTDLYAGYRLLLVAFVLLMNAFFAAAEVALVAVRPSRLRQLAEHGNAGAKAALSLLENPERLLSVVQVGVTLASLGLGWAGESTVYALLNQGLAASRLDLPPALLHAISFLVAFSLITYAHVVVGEVVPKNLAIERADWVAVTLAPGLLFFYRLSTPFVRVIERSAAKLSDWIGVGPSSYGGPHSAEELKLVVSAARRHGGLAPFEEKAIHQILELEDYFVREIMVPRSDVVSVPVDVDLDQLLTIFEQHLYSRLPVYEGQPENIIGYIHFKDLLSVWQARRQATARRLPSPRFDLRKLLRKPLVVPETKPVNQLIDEFRRARTHLATVVDEFGTVVGIVTLEDVLELIFGEIEDEHDTPEPLGRMRRGVLEVEGTINIRDLETQFGIQVPVDASFETLAGFILYKLGHIPQPGESVEHNGYRFTVLRMDRHRIDRVLIEPIARRAEPAGQEAKK